MPDSRLALEKGIEVKRHYDFIFCVGRACIATQSLRRAVALDPEIEELNHTVLRRIDSTYYREAEIDSENNTNRLIL